MLPGLRYFLHATSADPNPSPRPGSWEDISLPIFTIRFQTYCVTDTTAPASRAEPDFVHDILQTRA